jgi:hypothetical protein
MFRSRVRDVVHPQAEHQRLAGGVAAQDLDLAVGQRILERGEGRGTRRRRPGEVARRLSRVAELRIGLADHAQRIGIGVGAVGERAQGADGGGGIAAAPLGRAEQPPRLEIAGLALEQAR